MSDSTSYISVVFVPVEPLPGGIMTYHEALVYTTPDGSSYISAGPTVSSYSLGLNDVQKAENIVLAAASVGTNTPGIWGALKVEGSGSFTPNDSTPLGGVDVVPEVDPNTGVKNANAGTAYASQNLATGSDLSAQ